MNAYKNILALKHVIVCPCCIIKSQASSGYNVGVKESHRLSLHIPNFKKVVIGDLLYLESNLMYKYKIEMNQH